MTLERKIGFNISELQSENRLLQGTENKSIKTALVDLAGLMQLYNGAMKEVNVKLEIIDDEFQFRMKHNPIHHLECRLKPPRSIYAKIMRRGLDPSVEVIRKNILDIAGIRVVCNFLDDIYLVEKQLLCQHGIKLIERKDYIANPKSNGYRSLHLIITTPVCHSGKIEEISVEIQIRTIAMDYWASLEHKLRYKNNESDIQKYSPMLLDCANTLAKAERTMQHIRESIEN